MKTWLSALECGTKVVGFLFVLSCVSALAQSSVTPPSPTPASPPNAQPPSARELKAWRQTLSRIPRPKTGCFKSSYPSLQWQEVPCTTAPLNPHGPASGPLPSTVGNGRALVARVPGRILRAAGSFNQPVGKVDVGSFSLQLNSNFYQSPPACGGAREPINCWGWQQFIFDYPGIGPVSLGAPTPAYMQYWLINYNNPCPSGDLLHPWQQSGADCYRNSDAINPIHAFAAETLNGLVLSGSTEGGTDTVGISIEATGEFLVASGQDSFLDLGPNWQAAEFNVFGYCCSAQANFKNPTYINVSLAVDDGTSNAPMCFADQGTTGETNSLTILRTSCCPHGGASPELTFAESNMPDAPSPACQPTETAVQTAVQYVRRQFGHP